MEVLQQDVAEMGQINDYFGGYTNELEYDQIDQNYRTFRDQYNVVNELFYRSSLWFYAILAKVFI
jgi:hypothetical protein